MVHIRDDLVERYPADRVDQFIRTSRHLHTDLQYLDDEMGSPTASLHVLDDLIVQFHSAGDDVVFLSMDRDVGRNFTQFIDDCLDRVG